MGIRFLIIVAVIGALFGAHLAYSSHYIDVGRDQVTGERDKQDAANNTAAKKLLDDANVRAKNAGELLAAKTAEFETNRAKENLNHENALKTERARALAGASRLRCPGGPANQTDPAGPGGNRPAAGGPGAEAGTYLVPGAADAIFGIASDSAKLVRDYNEVVDLYAEARKACMSR